MCSSDLAIPLRGLEGVPGLPGAPQDEAGLTNQSILKDIGPGCSLEELMLKLKLQYFGP